MIYSCERTDRCTIHDEARGRFSQFCESTQKIIKYLCDDLVYFCQLHGGLTVLNLSNLCFTENTIHLHYKHQSTTLRIRLFILTVMRNLLSAENKSIFKVKWRIIHSNQFTGIYGHSYLQERNHLRRLTVC
jgi:hypothetical protein